jgi:hypothetical protein
MPAAVLTLLSLTANAAAVATHAGSARGLPFEEGYRMGGKTDDAPTAIGAAELQLQFDFAHGSLVQITALEREFLSGPTPVWQLTATDFESVFPAGAAVDSLSSGAGHH